MLFNYKYGGSTSVASTAKSVGMSFAPDTHREPTFFVGSLAKHIPFREAISALHDVVISDLRFKPKDKTAYKAWVAQQEELWLAEAMAKQTDHSEQIGLLRKQISESYNQSNKVMKPYYDARSKYFKYIYKRDYDAWFVLDPVITIHPDEIFFECFSQDESSYGKLSCDYNVFKKINEFSCGTTNIDYSASLYNEFQKIRDYKETEFKVDPSGFEVQTTNEDTYKEVKIDLPESWVRGFLQVSSAMTLPATSFDLHPMDIHNMCLMLRRNKAKVSPRSMKFILTPGHPIKIVFEPWNHEIICHRSPYTGSTPTEVRCWGRRRLLILERLIPIAQSFTVTLLGTGLPSFYQANLGDMTFTLGLSGWTANDWSKAGNFDLMAPRATVDSLTKQLVFKSLKEKWAEDADSLAKRIGLKKEAVLGALSIYTQAGRVIYDLNKKVYRVRELAKDPLPMSQLRYANEREKAANKHVEQNKVNVKAEILAGGKLKLTGTVGYNSTQPSMVIDNEQRIVEASCSCHFYNKNKLFKGPCEHMLALRIAHRNRN